MKIVKDTKMQSTTRLTLDWRVEKPDELTCGWKAKTDWVKVKKQCQQELGYVGRVENKKQCIRLAKAIEAKGFDANVCGHWGFPLMQFSMRK
jgi:hypothetical protein|tara:strand:- start:868 stop:1143 length:276 start_codon:yes stop_codon:yes gene_type:complete